MIAKFKKRNIERMETGKGGSRKDKKDKNEGKRRTVI